MEIDRQVQQKLLSLCLDSIKEATCFTDIAMSEGAWQGFIFILLKKQLYNHSLSNFEVVLDYKFKIGNGRNLWLSENQFEKFDRSDKLSKYFTDIKKEGIFYNINVESITTPLSHRITTIVNTQSIRQPFKIDMCIIDKNDLLPYVFIELKYGNKINEVSMLDDIIKLEKMYQNLHGKGVFSIAAGCNKQKLFLKNYDSSETKTHELQKDKHAYSKLVYNQKAISVTNTTGFHIDNFVYDKTCTYIDTITDYKYFNEHLWNCYLVHDLIQVTGERMIVQREFPGKVIGMNGAFDIALHDLNYNVETLIELKYSMEQGIPDEMQNGLMDNIELQKIFINHMKQCYKFFPKIPLRGLYPKMSNGKVYFWNDFIDKVFEICIQYKRLSEAVKNRKAKRGIMIFFDWIWEEGQFAKNNINMEDYNKCIKLRENIIRQLISPFEIKGCCFLYVNRLKQG